MRNYLILLLMALVAMLRISGMLPPNVAPVAAIALFGGAMFTQRWMAVAVPFGIMAASDLFLGLHPSLWAVYLGFGITIGFGMLIAKKPTVVSALGASLAASIIFFIITNGASWWALAEYSKDLNGLTQSYVAGLPFFRNSLLGDLFFTLVMFGAWQLAERRVPQLARA